MISRPGWQLFLFFCFLQAKRISEVNLKSGSEEKKADVQDPQIPQVYLCPFFFFFFTDVRKPGLHNVIMYLSIVGQPDMWVWLRSFILFLNQCNLPAVQYPPPFQAPVTFHFYSSWTNCCWAWFLISACPNPLNLHCKCFNDRPACLWANVRMGLETGMSVFEILYQKKKWNSPCLVIDPLHPNELCNIFIKKQRTRNLHFPVLCLPSLQLIRLTFLEQFRNVIGNEKEKGRTYLEIFDQNKSNLQTATTKVGALLGLLRCLLFTKKCRVTCLDSEEPLEKWQTDPGKGCENCKTSKPHCRKYK